MGARRRAGAVAVPLAQMNENRRAAPTIWQPDWLVLREMARVLRARLADPELALRGARILDFGCGGRPYERWFADAGAHYRGADIDAGHEVAIRADGTLDCADGEYDLVVSFQVLEHVWDVATYLHEARRVLRRGGCLLLSTHGAWLYHPHPHDYRRWTAEGLQRDVEAQGFRLTRMEALVGPLAWTTIFRALGTAHLLRMIPLIGPVVLPAVTLAFNGWAWMQDRLTPAHITATNACVYMGVFRRDG
jgi:SAM-dependent methyltransferase